MTIVEILTITGIPSAVVALFSSWIIRSIKKSNECREDAQIIQLEMVDASVELGEATALAIKRGQTNGEMDKALKKAKMVKAKQEVFLRKVAARKIY